MNEHRAPAGTITQAVTKVAAKVGGVAGGKKPAAPAPAKAGPDANGKKAVPKAGGGPSSPAGQEAAQKAEAIALAVDAGWTMALLFGELRPPVPGRQSSVSDRLPTEHELEPDQRKQLEGKRVNALLARLGALLAASPDPKPGAPLVPLPAGPPAAAAAAGSLDQASLTRVNLEILEWLACAGREYGLAYQLGRSLRDTASPPPRLDAEKSAADQQEITSRETQLAPKNATPDDQQKAADRADFEFGAREAVISQLSRGRVGKIQEWLSALTPYLPGDAAAIVSASIGRWADLTSTIFDKNTKGRLRWFRGQSELEVAGAMADSLLIQGDAWINLLVGAESSAGLLTPEGYVAAGEAALDRTARIIRKIATRYWYVLAILAIAVAAALYFAARDVGGAAKVWTQIATVATALGVTAKGVGSAMARLSADAEKPIYGLEKVDAMAWSVTTIPDNLRLTIRGVSALRQSGIVGSGPMGRS